MNDRYVHHNAGGEPSFAFPVTFDTVLRIRVGVEVVGLCHDIRLQTCCSDHCRRFGDFLRLLHQLHLAAVGDSGFGIRSIGGQGRLFQLMFV